MPTTRMPGRHVVILMDTHRAWLVDTEAANDVVPDAERTFSPPPARRVCWSCAATLVVVAVAVVAFFWWLAAVGAHRLWGA